MITAVEARNTQGSLLGLTLDDPSSGFLIEDIGGLGPVKATLVSSSFAGLDGESYQSARRDARNITLKINLEPDYVTQTVGDLRRGLYAYFMPKSQVSLRFVEDSGLQVDIVGRVESFEPNLFTREPSVDISIMCFEPDFVEATPTVYNGSANNTTVFSEIVYDGSVESGVLFTLYPNRALSEFTIYHTPADGIQRTLEFLTPLIAGDVLRISTIPGAKGAVLTRAGVDTSVLYGISPQSNWLEFEPGTNLFRVFVNGAIIPYSLQWTNKYGGL